MMSLRILERLIDLQRHQTELCRTTGISMNRWRRIAGLWISPKQRHYRPAKARPEEIAAIAQFTLMNEDDVRADLGVDTPDEELESE